MATLTPTNVLALQYRNGQTSSATRVQSITDGNATNYEFTAGESITINFVSSGGIVTSESGTFKGTTTAISGGPYAVVEYTDSSNVKWTFVIGSGLPAFPPRTVAALNINTTDPLPAPCFLTGTLIATPSGERRVEDLVPGDPVLIEDDDAIPATWSGRLRLNLRRRLGFGRSVPVKWLGRQTVSTRFGPAERLMPVRFAAGSLGGGGGGLPSAA